MLIAAAAAGAASTLYDSLTTRKSATTQADPQDPRTDTQPVKRPKPNQPLSPAANKLVAAAQSMLLGVQAGAG